MAYFVGTKTYAPSPLCSWRWSSHNSSSHKHHTRQTNGATLFKDVSFIIVICSGMCNRQLLHSTVCSWTHYTTSVEWRRRTLLYTLLLLVLYPHHHQRSVTFLSWLCNENRLTVASKLLNPPTGSVPFRTSRHISRYRQLRGCPLAFLVCKTRKSQVTSYTDRPSTSLR